MCEGCNKDFIPNENMAQCFGCNTNDSYSYCEDCEPNHVLWCIMCSNYVCEGCENENGNLSVDWHCSVKEHSEKWICSDCFAGNDDEWTCVMCDTKACDECFMSKANTCQPCSLKVMQESLEWDKKKLTK